jgi:hypothetical protein
MKKIGEYTLRGKVDHGSSKEIRLFDGSFKTGYRVVEFTIFAREVSTSDLQNFSAFLGTTDSLSPLVWEWENQEQIAWSAATFDGNGSGTPSTFTQIDPENLIVEDLYVYLDSNLSTAANYFIKMEKYEITDWQGALALVKNNAQSV